VRAIAYTAKWCARRGAIARKRLHVRGVIAGSRVVARGLLAIAVMQKHTLFVSTLVIAIAVAACGGDADDTGAQAQGIAACRDATMNADGTAREPTPPPAQDARLEVTVSGTGTLDGIDPTCLDQASGQFRAIYDGTMAVGDDGAYVASLAEIDGRLESPLGCAIDNVTAGVVTDVVVRAEIEATTANCDWYCAAHGRAEAQAECSARPDRATCWSTVEAEAGAACRAACTTDTDLIVAEISLGAGAIGTGELDGDALRAAAFGDMQVDVTFDHFE
jgi:hypothetical protein